MRLGCSDDVRLDCGWADAAKPGDEVEVQGISQLGLGDGGVIPGTFHPNFAGHGMIKERIYKEVDIAQHH